MLSQWTSTLHSTFMEVSRLHMWRIWIWCCRWHKIEEEDEECKKPRKLAPTRQYGYTWTHTNTHTSARTHTHTHTHTQGDGEGVFFLCFLLSFFFFKEYQDHFYLNFDGRYCQLFFHSVLEESGKQAIKYSLSSCREYSVFTGLSLLIYLPYKIGFFLFFHIMYQVEPSF